MKNLGRWVPTDVAGLSLIRREAEPMTVGLVSAR